MDDLKVTLHDQGFRGWADALRAKLTDMRPLFEEIGNIVMRSIEKSMQLNGRTSGEGGDPWEGGAEKWPDLEDVTKKLREKRKTWPGQILRDSGQLAASIHKEVFESSVVVGTNKEYAATHQFGARRGEFGAVTRTSKKGKTWSQALPWGEIPARPFLNVQDEDWEEIDATVLDYLAEAGDD